MIEPSSACPSCSAPNEDRAAKCANCSLPVIGSGLPIAGRYELVERLGRGGMGAVFKVHDRKLDETVALKVLRPDVVSREAEKRFQDEIKLARRVAHRNVCRIFEYGEDGPLRFIVMEYVQGETVRSAVRNGTLSVAALLELLAQAADGLAAIHEAGIVHRDIKTVNMMVARDGMLKLMDFGIAKQIGAEAGVTSTGFIVGTPEYMSPEQALGKAIDGRSDLYALGIVLYDVFAGELPFRGDTPFATLWKHANEPVPLDTEAGRRVPEVVRPILRDLLAKTPDGRPSQATELSMRLRAAARALSQPTLVAPASANTAPASTSRQRADPGRRSSWLWIAGAAAAAGVVVIAAIGIPHAPRSQPPSTMTPVPTPLVDTRPAHEAFASVNAATATRTLPPVAEPTAGRETIESPSQPSRVVRQAPSSSTNDVAIASRESEIRKHLQEARNLYSLREYAAALARCDAALELDRGSREARSLRAQIEETQRLLRRY